MKKLQRKLDSFVHHYLQETNDPEQVRQIKLLVYFSVIITSAAISYGAVYLLLHMPLSAVGAGLAALLAPLNLWRYKQNKAINIAGHRLTATAMLALVTITFATGAMNSIVLSWMILIPIIGTMLVGRQGGTRWFGAVVLFCGLLFAVKDASIIPSSEVPQWFDMIYRLIVVTGLGAVILVIAHSFEGSRDEALDKLNVTNLALGQERDRAEQAHEAARQVLDNMAQGLIMVRLDGTIDGEHSAQLERWFGPPQTRETLWRWLGRRNSSFASWLEVGWQELESEWLPLELVLSQLPAQLELDGQYMELEYKPVEREGEPLRVLVIITDVSEQLEAQRLQQEQQELMAVFFKTLRDAKGVYEYFDEAEQLMEKIVSGAGDEAQEKRWIHTLKGNSGIFGLKSFARSLHKLEDQLQKQGHRCSPDQLEQLSALWIQLNERLSPLMQQRGKGILTIERHHVERLIASIESGAYGEQVAKEMKRWTWDSVPNRLDMLAERAHILAQNIGKGQINIVIDSEKLWQPPSDSWRAFWSAAIHVLRNAVDHGLEDEDERVEAGKAAAGTLILRARGEQERMVIEFSDDGRGIDWGAVERKAKKMGLPYDTRQALEAALFADGLSTRDQVSELSGRGVGMQAVKEVCEALGGSIQIESAQGQGTTFRFIIPSAPIQSARTQGADNDDASLDDLLTLSA